jgi:hypothetical protein
METAEAAKDFERLFLWFKNATALAGHTSNILIPNCTLSTGLFSKYLRDFRLLSAKLEMDHSLHMGGRPAGAPAKRSFLGRSLLVASLLVVDAD